MYLTATNQTLELETSSAEAVHWTAAWADHTTTTFTPGSAEGTISAATTTQIVAAPGSASVQRQIKHLTVINRGSASNTVLIKKDVGGTEYAILRVPLAANEYFEYEDGA